MMALALSNLPASQASAHDARFMRLAMNLGARHLGRTWPNPSVGAVVVREDGAGPIILAQGITQPGGRPHAERIALERAGAAARGGTLYVSLEPCSHHGRTPPCVDAILAAGVNRVVTALEDPDPRVSGRGHDLLRARGIDVVTDVLGPEAKRVHRGHITRVTRGRPAVTLKLAQTRAGISGRSAGPRLLITGESANWRVHLMRSHADAVVVGVGTVLADDPLLTVRLPGLAHQPVRVVFDSHLRTPTTCRLVASADAVPTWILTSEEAPDEAARRLSDLGVIVIRARCGSDGQLDLADAMASLSQRGLTRVLCEGGPSLAEALAAADLIDECVLITSDHDADGDVQGIRPGLAAALARMIPLLPERAGGDRIETYERG
jgi:diaminohydroxyphosphoribosylaminopyrimidine deaminase/5-amino-6-(5-phosphoribosylamino)uracil reductase